MAFVRDVVGGVFSYFLGDSTPTQPPIGAPIEVFKQKLLQFSTLSIDQEQCIQACVQSATHSLSERDFWFSESSQKTIELHLENFNKAVDEKLLLSSSQGKVLKASFAKSFCAALEDYWAKLMAPCFYSAASITDSKLQIAAAQKWTHQFILGASCFSKWGRDQFYISHDLVTALSQKMSSAFRTYSHQMLQDKMNQMQKRAEKDPISFAKECERISAKKDNDPASLSPEEKEIYDFFKIVAKSVMGYFPDIDNKIILLNKCIWHGYSLQQFSQSILDSNTSHGLFKTTFDKDEVDEKT